jgi:hypothetical protein
MLYQTSSHTLLSEIDRRHLIDLMQVDRIYFQIRQF